jgi:hypothetical protein
VGRKFPSDIAEKRRAKRSERQGWRTLIAEEATVVPANRPVSLRYTWCVPASPNQPENWEPGRGQPKERTMTDPHRRPHDYLLLVPAAFVVVLAALLIIGAIFG